MKTILLIDGMSLFYRFYWAPFRNLSIECPASDCDTGCIYCEGEGRESTKATWLFLKWILQLIKQHNPTYLAVVFDGERSNLHRRHIYPKYKLNRDQIEKPKGIQPQLRRITQLLKTLGIRVIQADKHEADDYLATLARRYATDRREVTIVSRDHDLLLCCGNPNVFVLDPVTDKYASMQTAGRRCGLDITQLQDYFILTGDSSDNVPGVKGFGEKTAAKYLRLYNSINGCLIAATMSYLPKRLAENLVKANATGWLEKSRQLLTLVDTVPIMLKRIDMLTPVIELKRIRPLLRLLRFQESLL